MDDREELARAVLAGRDYASHLLEEEFMMATEILDEVEEILGLNGFEVSHHPSKADTSCAIVASFASGLYQTLFRRLQ